MYTINNIADALLMKMPMSHKKLQKMCYYVLAWSFKEPTLEWDSKIQFEAWDHGPVEPTLYNKYRCWEWRIIPPKKKLSFVADKDFLKLIDLIINVYGPYSANELEKSTHSELPWISARSNYSGYGKCKEIIPRNEMIQYYKKLIS